MRKILLLLPLAFAAPISAQAFEGTIVMTVSPDGKSEPIQSTMYIDGTTMAMVMTLPASAGPVGGMEARMIVNNATSKMTMLLPAPPGMPLPPGSKGMKMVRDIPKGTDTKQPDVNVKKLGTSQTIAGMSCDDYQATTDGNVVNMCVTDQLGEFTLPTGGMGRGSEPAWVHAFGDKPMFPLKVWSTTDGKSVEMEVISITRGSVPAAMLNESPEGYVDMSSMMRRGGN